MKFSPVVLAVITVIFLMLGAYFIPWRNVSWGSIVLRPAERVTVTGEAKTEQKTQIATYTAGVGSVNINKDVAVKEVNDTIAEIVTSVEKFGVAKEDIKTQNLSIYQDQESYWDAEGQTQRNRAGQWRVNNTIEIKLRDITRAGEFADLLASGGATNVWGPNFSLDDTKETEMGLLHNAVEDARKKAEALALASGKKLGEIIDVSEGSISTGVYPFERLAADGYGGGAVVEPGTQIVSKTVTVSFELK